MYLVVKNDDGTVEQVYGYVSISNIVKYAKDKYPDANVKWAMSIPFDYSGDIKYLPEDKE